MANRTKVAQGEIRMQGHHPKRTSLSFVRKWRSQGKNLFLFGVCMCACVHNVCIYKCTGV